MNWVPSGLLIIPISTTVAAPYAEALDKSAATAANDTASRPARVIWFLL
jgi:hypothetical protein